VALATVEICSAVFLKETLSIAGYEGARVGVKRRATMEDALATVNAVLEARGIEDADVDISPEDFDSLDALDPITITVSAPITNNSAYVSSYFYGKTVSSSVVMVREFDD
jgi:hypothetical protein